MEKMLAKLILLFFSPKQSLRGEREMVILRTLMIQVLRKDVLHSAELVIACV